MLEKFWLHELTRPAFEEWLKNDPRQADPDEAGARFEEKVDFLLEFIRVWKTIPLPVAFGD